MTLESISIACLFLSLIVNVTVILDARRQRRLRMERLGMDWPEVVEYASMKTEGK